MRTLIDTNAVKRASPIADVVARYGIELRRVGRALVGRCPFHPDGGRPNLYVYGGNASWYCYRCGIGGDVIGFVMRLEGLGFRDAVARLGGGFGGRPVLSARPVGWPPRRRRPLDVWGVDERACVAAATELYHNRLLTDPAALRYVEERGLARATLERCRIGYAHGDEMLPYLRWRRLPIQAAIRVGLIGRDGREFLAGRVVVPEIRRGQPIWLVGRALDSDGDAPKYLGLPGRKPLLGWEIAAGHPTAILVEGVFDWLTLVQWGFPALALVGTRVRPEVLRALGSRFGRLYLALDADLAGQEATDAIAQALGARAVPLPLPTGVKDVADLGPAPDGRVRFIRAFPDDADLSRAA
jgi:DNA primase